MNKHWFRKRKGLMTKDLGWGWRPITWEGHLTTAGFVALILVAFFIFDLYKATLNQGIGFIVALAVLILIFSLIANKKTEA